MQNLIIRGHGKFSIEYEKESDIVNITVSQDNVEIKFSKSLDRFIEWAEGLRQKGDMWKELSK